MINTLNHRRNTAANWTSTNPILAFGEVGLETDTGRFKFGDGATAWNSLAYGSPVAANPTATIGLTATNGSAATFLRSDGAPALSQAIAPTWTGVHTYTPAARSSGVSPYYTINAPADTGITASTEAIGISIVGATRTRAAGAVTTQREVVIAAPTYAAASATTITTAATVAIAAAPTAGTNVTITNPRALWVQAGISQFDGQIAVADGTLANPGLVFNSTIGGSNTGLRSTGTGISVTYFGVNRFHWDLANNYVAVDSIANISWSNSSGNASATYTLNLTQASASVLRIGNGTTGPGGISSAARSPAQIAADTNNYAPGVGMFQRWTSDASRNVTGMVAGVDGEMRYVWNVGAQNIVLTHQDAASTAANRWLSSTGANLTLSPDKCAMCMYDATTQRWRVTLLP